MAPTAFEALLSQTGELTRIARHAERGPKLADALSPGAFRSGAIQRLSLFARKPRLADAPGRRLLRSAARWTKLHDEPEAAELVTWCGTLLNLVEACRGTARDGAFLNGLAATDFPIVLLWSNAHLARQIFMPSGADVAIAPSVLANKKSCRKAVTTCLRYIFGSFGRFGPRAAWIGAGFGTTDGAERPAVIDPADEAIRIEPDIRWMARHWFAAEAAAIKPGEDAWSHVRRSLRMKGAGSGLVATLEALRASVEALGDRYWSYADVDAFLKATESVLSKTVDDRVWQTDPHRWWLTRVLEKQLQLRPSIKHDCERLYERTRSRWLEAGLSDDAAQGVPRTGPLPLRAVRTIPSALIGHCEEFVDWVLQANAIRHGPRAFLPRDIACPCAIVVHIEGDRARYKLHEPNALRTAVGIGRHLDGSIRYLGCDPDAAAIAPPPQLIDQRLLRKPSAELPVDRIPEGKDAMFRSALAGAEVEAQVSRELASPRYRCAPDLLPAIHDDDAAEEVSFGRLDATNGTLVLPVEAARALAAQLRDPGLVAAFYWLEISAPFGSPAWIGALVDGKTSRFPVASSTAFRWLLHACRTSKQPIVLNAQPYSAQPPVLCDTEGRPLALELYAAIPD